jgi:hemolysin D
MGNSSRRKSSLRSGFVSEHIDFLPTAEALLARPVSPIYSKLTILICALCFAALLGACLGHIDIYAVAGARIQPTGRSKIIQPLETGRVRKIHVANGTIVREGDLLIELDSTESAADRTAVVVQLEALRAETARRRLAIEVAQESAFNASPRIPVTDAQPATIEREQAVLDADLAQLRSELAALDARHAEILTQKSALRQTIRVQGQLIATLQAKVDMSTALLARQLGSRLNQIDAQQEYGEQLTVLTNQRGELARIEAAVVLANREKDQAIRRFIAENTQALATAQARSNEFEQELVKSSARLGHTQLRAPIAGTVQELAITTIGQVVGSGHRLMTIVPQNAPLEAEALVLNKDVGFIGVGQPVTLKIEAFPFTIYGTLKGHIAHISHDAVSVREADSGTGAQPTIAAASEVSGLVYPVRIVLDSSVIQRGNVKAQLAAGMSARAEIRTGERRVIEYFLSPLFEVTSEVAHER